MSAVKAWWTWWKARAPFLWMPHAKAAICHVLLDADAPREGMTENLLYSRVKAEFFVPYWAFDEALMHLVKEGTARRDSLTNRWYHGLTVDLPVFARRTAERR